MTQTTKQPTEDTAFHITDEASANWYLRKLANIEAEKQRITAQYETMIKELETDAAGLKFLYESELQEYVRRELARKGGRKKTLHLLQGTCSFRIVPASLKLSDSEMAFTFAKENGLPCIQTQERLDADAYRHLCKQTGAALPGTEVVPERESFAVKFGA